MSAVPETDQPVGFDVERIGSWLAEHTDLGAIEDVELLNGGRSNLTYRMTTSRGAYVVRRPPPGDLLPGAHDVAREHRLTVALADTGVPVAPPVALCEDRSVIGVPFSVAAYVEGLTLRTARDAEALHLTGDGALARRVAETLASLHHIDPEVTGLPSDRGHGYLQRQLRVWQRQLQSPPRRPLPGVERVADALAATLPEQTAVAIVHGDLRLDNLRVGADGSVRAVIDWELWTLGDPFADLGIALAYWTDGPWELAALGDSPTVVPGLGSREDLCAAYLDAYGQTLTDRRLWWYAAFGVWRFAAILEGVHRRHLRGSYAEITEGDGGDGQDWTRFQFVVPALAEQAMGLLRRGRWV